MAHQQRQRQQARHDVGGQLALAHAEDGQWQQHPHQQKADRGLALLLPGIHQGFRQQGSPGQAGGQQDRQVEPPGLGVLRIGRAKTTDMFVPEKELPEVRLLMMDRQRPRQADRHCHKDRQRAIAQHLLDAPLPQGIGHGDQYGQ